ncbi:RING/U-box protein with C6HC-type zinc finger [Euphorbia peplus]|nr:RING/U-box protein with C6HC-type zinc finger [Euphorbia peplus]
MAAADDLHCILSEQRRELTAAESLESDLDFAFHLQLQEAINASVAALPSSSSAPPPETSPPEKRVTVPALHSEELDRLEQLLTDQKQSELEMRRMREDLDRRIHDQKLAREISRIPDDDWEEWGDHFEKPYGEGTSRDVGEDNGSVVFGLYFKGLASEEVFRGEKAVLGGIGVAICDPVGNLVFEVSKPLIGNGLSRQAAEAKALIEGLNAALALELKRVTVYCDYKPLYQFVSGRWPARQRKVAMLVNQVSVLQKKFTYCNSTLVARNNIKFAFKLARDAIVSQITKPVEPNCQNTVNETCVICLEDTDVRRIFSIEGCGHRYCFSCMKQHVEVKLLHGMVPKCPHEGCKTELDVESSSKFLTSKLAETMRQRKKEAAIPATEKVYCPYPQCSALMSNHDVSEYSKKEIVGSAITGARKCLECRSIFCINCKVPWHSNMSCHIYKKMNPNPPAEDVKLKSLATRNLWRQCVKCSHMIELAEGCYHMTCRCGFEFCYNCGAEWKDKKPTCSCPLWDEDNIWDDEDRDEEDDLLRFESDSEFGSDDDDYLF